MKMNKEKQVFGTVEYKEENKDYTGLVTDTAEVLVNNTTREISVNVDFQGMLGQTATTAYPGHLGAQNRALVLEASNKVDKEITRAEQAERALQESIEDVSWQRQLDKSELRKQITAETNRAKTAEAELLEESDKLRSDILNVEQSLDNKISATAQDLATLSRKQESDVVTLRQNTRQVQQMLETAIVNESQTRQLADANIEQHLSELAQKTESKQKELENTLSEVQTNYADKQYVYEKLVEFTSLSKQIVDSVDLQNNVIILEGESSDPIDGVLYLVKDPSSKGSDVYKEYTTIDSKLTLIGDTSVDLTGYATEKWVEDRAYLTEHKAATDYAQLTYVEAVTEELREFVTTSIEEIPEVDLTPYAKTEDLPTKLSEFENDADYAQKSDIPDVSSFIAEIPEEYVTEQELTEKGYYNLADITALLSNIEFIDGGNAPL